MGHRKWVKARSWREFHADDMIAEHNALYDAWVVEGDRADDLLKDRNAIQHKLDEARAAIAHLSKRPEGLPTAEELAKQAHEIMLQKYPTDYYIPYEDCDSKVIVSRKRFSDAILTALRPWLRDPVGFELDIRPGMLRDSVALHSEESFLKWLRSRIRPVYECREFRQWRKDWDTQAKACEMLSKAYSAASKQLNAARAALEGE